jgi:hypothetical protein
MRTKRLSDVAAVIRSKNASPFKLTVDIFFNNKESYLAFKESKILTKDLIARLYGISPAKVETIFYLDEALGAKVSFIKPVASDELGSTDVYGAQQHAPLLDLIIPETGTKKAIDL